VRLVAGKWAHDGTYTYRNFQGHVVEADLHDYMERIGFFGAHSSRLIRYMASLLQPGDWAIDAGANVGLMSSPMAAAVGPKGCVWAIEPLSRNLQRLYALKEANGLDQLEILPVALSSTTSMGRLRLSYTAGGSGTGSFVAPWAKDEFVDVPTTALDTLVQEKDPGRPLRFIKMDVEGFEGELLTGAKDTLTTKRPFVLCEFHDPLLRAAGTSAAELLDRFAEYGYAPRPPFDGPPNTLDGKICDLLLVPQG
jgi:FkbM family methyltransferase